MKRILTILFILISYLANAQTPTKVTVGSTRAIDTNEHKANSIFNGNIKLRGKSNTDPAKALTTDADGDIVLATITAQAVVDSTLYVTVTRLRDSLAAVRADMGGAVVDSSVYVTITRLIDSLNGVRTYIATNYYNKTQSDERYLQSYTETDPIYLSDSARLLHKYDSVNASGYVSRRQVDTAKQNIRNEIAGKSDTAHGHTLQEVTAAGNTTTYPITVLDVNFDSIPGYSAARAAANLFAGKDSVKVAMCILKPDTIGVSKYMSWKILADVDHLPLRFDSLSYGSGPIMTVYFSPAATKIMYCSVTPDETFANYGVTAGAQANLDNIKIQFSWDKGVWAGWTFRDSTNTWRFSPNIASSAVTETGTNGVTWEETSSTQMGGRINTISDYQGMSSSGYTWQYAGANGYQVVKSDNHPYYLLKRFDIVDAYGNPVPLTALTHLDKFHVTSNRSFRLNPQWYYNIWDLASTAANFWIILIYE